MSVLISLKKGLGGQGVCQSQQGPVEAPGIVKAHIGYASGTYGPVREREGKSGALSGGGFRHEAAAHFLGDPLAQGEPQTQAVGRGVQLLRREVPAKEEGHLLGADTLPVVSDRKQDPIVAQTQLHGDLSTCRREFEGVGQQLEQQLLQTVGVHSADVLRELAAVLKA